MSISYTWSVENLYRKTNNDAVFAVDIKITAADGTNTASITNSLHLDGADPTSSDWVNYADLTEDKCLGWVKAAFTGLEDDMQFIAKKHLEGKTTTPSSAKGKPF